jgi:peroxiredoxin
MVELGQLESLHEKFDARNTQIVAVSLDSPQESAKTATKFPHLIIVSDEKKSLSGAAEVIGPQRGPDGNLTVSPTTVLIDHRGNVRWVGRPDRFIERISPDEVLAKVDETLVRK